jgi:hypothetical protein
MNETQAPPVEAQPIHAQPTATYGITPPSHQPHARRPWPLAARLALGVLTAVLGAALIAALIAVRAVSVRASRASQQAAAEAVSLAALGRELAAVQAKVAAPAKVYHLPAIYQHEGFCVSFSRNSGNGDLVDVNLTAPQVVAGQYTCPQGAFISVVPRS